MARGNDFGDQPSRAKEIDRIILCWLAGAPMPETLKVVGLPDHETQGLVRRLIYHGVLNARPEGWTPRPNWQARLDALKSQEEK